jgi:hypothetical protein
METTAPPDKTTSIPGPVECIANERSDFFAG